MLSKRLKELEDCGVVQRRPVRRKPEVMAYRLTRSGKELAPIIVAIWMGLGTVAKAVDDGRLALTGDKELQKNLLKWLGLSTLAGVKKQVP